MRRGDWAALLLAAALASGATAQEQEFVGGDGTTFALEVTDGLPARADSDTAMFESAGFDIVTDGALSVTDRFAFLFKGGDRPIRVRVEDITLPSTVVIAEASVPEGLPGAGFRRVRFELQGPTCAIARGEPCSAWMFGTQSFRLYRVTLTYADRAPVTLLQAEPFQMSSFIARLGDRIPDRTATRQQP
jgi:hypothetical protein